MPEEDKPFKFSELSKEAQERAIDKFRNKYYERLFDQIDADFLTEQFKQDLDDHYGLGEGLKVGWSLGYSQGDGVCFWGQIDVEKFLKTQKQWKKFGILAPVVNATIKHSGHYCHWNSMSIETELTGDAYSLLTPGELKQYESWNLRNEDIDYENQKRKTQYQRALKDPLYQYEQRLSEWKIKRGTGVKAWIPDPPPQPPTSIEVPEPPKLLPEPVMPKRLKRAIEWAEEQWTQIETTLANEFENYLDERIKEISRELEKNGYAEIDYHSSDECIREELENSPSYADLEFNEDGTFYED
jgi:hypothetical protein